MVFDPLSHWGKNPKGKKACQRGDPARYIPVCMFGRCMYVWMLYVCMDIVCMYGRCMYVWTLYVCMDAVCMYICMYGHCMYVWTLYVCMDAVCVYVWSSSKPPTQTLCQTSTQTLYPNPLSKPSTPNPQTLYPNPLSKPSKPSQA